MSLTSGSPFGFSPFLHLYLLKTYIKPSYKDTKQTCLSFFPHLLKGLQSISIKSYVIRGCWNARSLIPCPLVSDIWWQLKGIWSLKACFSPFSGLPSALWQLELVDVAVYFLYCRLDSLFLLFYIHLISFLFVSKYLNCLWKLYCR